VDRYGKKYRAGKQNVEFFLDDYDLGRDLNEQECREILLRVILQAKRDIINLSDSDDASDKEVWDEAKDFLFDDDYRIDWGDFSISFADIGAILNLNPSWERRKLRKEIAKGIAFRKRRLNATKERKDG